MISTSTYVGIIMLIAFSLLVPSALTIIWVVKMKEKGSSILAGAATWFVFAVILEAVPKSVLLSPSFPIGRWVDQNAYVYTIVAVLIAGFFEEIGRYVVFRFVLKNRTNRETAVSQGIGHGGMEAFFILIVPSIQYLYYANVINQGSFEDMVSSAMELGISPELLNSLPDMISAITPMSSLLSIAERSVAILFHIGLSVMVFYGVKHSRFLYCVMAILLHALFNAPAVLYQRGLISSAPLAEAITAVYAIIFSILVYRYIYKVDT